MGSRQGAKKSAQRVSEKPGDGPGDQRFRLNRALVILVGSVGGLLFVPPSVAWPLSVLRGESVGDGKGILLIVTALGWAGLALTVRFVVRPRLVLRRGELLANKFFFTQRIPLSAVRSIDRLKGAIAAVKPGRVDTLFLFRAHPEQPWQVDLALVDEPDKFVSALRGQCPVAYGSYTPQNAPEWLRG